MKGIKGSELLDLTANQRYGMLIDECNQAIQLSASSVPRRDFQQELLQIDCLNL